MAASAFAPGLTTALWATALGALGTMAVAFLGGRVLGRYRDIDVFWPLGFVVVAWIGFSISAAHQGVDHLQRSLLVICTSIWGLRLAGYLAWRSRGAGEDPRYEAILSRAKGSKVLYSLFIVYGLQGVLLWLVSLTVTVGMFVTGPLRSVEIVGVVIWSVGLGFEAIGDAQLLKFSKDPLNKGKVLDTGLWSWTRHPNYFGDACVWWGLFVLAASSGWGLLVFPAPLLMNILLVRVSGKAMTERRMAKTREGFEAYVARTSGFFPLPPYRG